MSQSNYYQTSTQSLSRRACLCAPLRIHSFGSARTSNTLRHRNSRERGLVRSGASHRDQSKAPSGEVFRRLSTAFAVVQFALLPIAGNSFADLDTTTEPAGVGAVVEGSDITSEDQRTVLAKLKEKILPEAKEILGRVGKGEGSNYPSSIAKELETVELEVNDLINQANKGGDMSNIKSAASGIEQQVNALKAIVGFD